VCLLVSHLLTSILVTYLLVSVFKRIDINIPFYESSSDILAYVLLSYNEMDLNFI